MAYDLTSRCSCLYLSIISLCKVVCWLHTCDLLLISGLSRLLLLLLLEMVEPFWAFVDDIDALDKGLGLIEESSLVLLDGDMSTDNGCLLLGIREI